MLNGKSAIATVADLGDPAAIKALRERDATKADRIEFTVDTDGMDYIAAFSIIPVSPGKEWTTVIIAPVDDFIGGLKKINRNLVVLILSLIALEVFLIVIVAKRIAQP
jgi:basic membrane lipoprotein Med (substrate-binding protein (PBP1-ABC) superfamily)